MSTMKEATCGFSANNWTIVTGVSRTPGDQGETRSSSLCANRGYEVFGINPRPTRSKALAATTQTSDDTIRECREHGSPSKTAAARSMFDPTADLSDKVIRVVLRSHVPKTI